MNNLTPNLAQWLEDEAGAAAETDRHTPPAHLRHAQNYEAILDDPTVLAVLEPPGTDDGTMDVFQAPPRAPQTYLAVAVVLASGCAALATAVLGLAALYL